MTMRPPIKLGELLVPVLEETETAANTGKRAGLTTGIDTLDEALCCIDPGTVTVIGGRPGMGKTSLALQIAWHATMANGKSVGFVSVGQLGHDLARMWLSMVSAVDTVDLRAGLTDTEDWRSTLDAVSTIYELPLFVVYERSPEMISQLTLEHKWSLLIVDYLQLLVDEDTNALHEYEQISRIMRDLKHHAITEMIPIVVVSQLTRKLEHRSDKRPKMYDLRGTGAIEDTADTVIMIYRDSYYNPSAHPDAAQLIIVKNRYGPTCDVDATFYATTNTWVSP